MSAPRLECPLCGVSFERGAGGACRACPMGAGCQMTCCPSCGYSWVDEEATPTGRFLRRWLLRRRPAGRRASAAHLLSDVPVGWKARLRSWESTPPRRRQQLRAYGLSEHNWIHILQHVPTTIIRVGRTELALDRELAETIVVEALHPADAGADEPPASA